MSVTRSNQPPWKPFTTAAITVFLAALAVRLFHIWQIRRAPFFSVLMGDAQAYDAWAQRLARGDWLGHEVFHQAPLYPYFLGVINTFAGPRSADCASVSGRDRIPVVCGARARRSAAILPERGPVRGPDAGALRTGDFFDSLLQKSVLDVFFICLSLWLLSNLIVDPARPRGWWWLGLAMGGLGLTRENALVLPAVVLFWALAPAHGCPAFRQRVMMAGVFVSGLALVLAQSHFATTSSEAGSRSRPRNLAPTFSSVTTLGPEFIGIHKADPAGHIGHFCLGVQNFDADKAFSTLKERGVAARMRVRGESKEIFLTDLDNVSVQLTDMTYCGGSGVKGNICKA